MDSVFALAAAPRALVLERAAARVPGCLYLCLWAPATAQLPSSHLFCLDAWIGGGARARASFEAYRGAVCAVVSGCVPGWAYRDGRAYMELPEPGLTASASLQVQQHFYHEAGTKTAVFMGCESGEIEIGLSSTSSAAAAAAADHLHQSFLEDLLQLPPAGLSSSSSTVPSLSIGSPEYSSLIRAMVTPVAAAGEPSAQPPMMQQASSQQPYSIAPFVGANEYSLLAQAMLAVTPSSVATSTISTPPPPWLASHSSQSQSQRSSPRRTTAFKPYHAALSPRARPRPAGAPGQRMIKTSISLLASVHIAMRTGRPELAGAHHEDSSAPPSTSQLHHVISERRRRERLNDSFQTLRALLPPGSKKDKANVLASTTEYMAKLVSQVTRLRERNLQLEAELGGVNQSASDDDDDPSGKTAEVEVVTTTGASTSSATPGQVSVRVTVRAECDLSEVLTSVLARLKDAGGFAVVSVEARQRSSALARASLTLRIAEAGDVVDEAWLTEALTKAVQDAVTKTPPLPPP